MFPGAPNISSPSEQSARYGDTALIECIMEGLPRPTSVTWKKDGHDLDIKHLRRCLLFSRSYLLRFYVYQKSQLGFNIFI